MTNGVRYYSWAGKPALVRDREARVIAALNSTEWSRLTGVDLAAIEQFGVSVGEGRFADLYASWNLPDLPGWFLSRNSTVPLAAE